MPSGAKPKQYPPKLVKKVKRLYESGLTQKETAEAAGVSQKVVWNLMRRHGITARKATPRNQEGENNANWKGNKAGYAGFHLRVERERGKPSVCSACETTTAKRYEWASLTKNYADVYDYVRLCKSCHSKMDNIVRNLIDKG